MLGSRHYVPILKWKRGEQRALGALADHIRDRITPLIEIVPANRDPDTGEPDSDYEAVVRNAVQALVTQCGDRPFFLDWQLVSDEDTGSSQSAGAILTRCVADSGLQGVPVTGLQRPRHEQDLAVTHCQNGLCLRLTLGDFTDGLDSLVNAFHAQSGVKQSQVDLVVDLEQIENASPAGVLAQARMLLMSIPRLGAYRSLTLAASAFPKSKGSVQSGEVVSRTEWWVWNTLCASPGTLCRLPTFGDYAVQHPDLLIYDPRLMKPVAAIRYALPSEWLFIRGRSVKDHGFKQFRVLARQLVQRAEFQGPNHCRGCQMIDEISRGDVSQGNLETWVVICTTHHMTVVAESLANPGGP